MPLTLSVTSYQRVSPGQEAVKVIDRQSASLGRAPDNDWVLSDPERVLSGRHCTIEYRDGGYFITDTSTNGIFINESQQRLGRGKSARLNDGDRFTLGDYEIQVSLSHSEENDTPAAQSFEDLFPRTTPSLSKDPFEQSPGSSTPAASQAGIIPDDIDLIDTGDAEPEKLGSERDDLPAEQEFFRPPEAVSESIPEDWDPQLSEESGPGTETDRIRIPASVAGVEPAVLQAFLAGAGLPHLQIADADVPKVMNELGGMFHQMVLGLMEVLAARSSIKAEFRLAQTTIRPTANNPLKFSLSVEDAMVNLLTKRGASYLPPVQAVGQGFDDIKAHQLAVMAGMQASLTHLLRRFDPKTLEARLGQSSVLDNILPAHRKAKYWDVFNALYAEIAREAEDDFHELFGKEFGRVYEELLRKL